MLANAKLSQEFTVLNQQYRKLVASLLEAVDMHSEPMQVPATREGNFRGFDADKMFVITEGSLTARYQGRTVYILEAGDILLPDITGTSDLDATVFYGSDAGATLACYPALEFMRKVLTEPVAMRVWTRLLITYSGIMVRIAAASIEGERLAMPGFEVYQPGEVIIRQGESADFVFNLLSGSAEVLVDDVVVGRVEEGEIFGAMAALTNAQRSATVRAFNACSVAKVPRDQFTELIKNNPATIHGLLVDMANSIVNLNEQLVALRGIE